VPTAAVDVDALGRWLREFASRVRQQQDTLTRLDAAIGDADHGTNLTRGTAAVVAMLDATPPTDPAALLKATGMTLVSSVGGASGPLYGTLFLRMATAASTAATTATGLAADGSLDAAGFAAALRAGLDGVLARGRAVPGDKTLVDALAPACDALDAALAQGEDLPRALSAAASAAQAGRDATIAMTARKGRASYLGERSAGHQDPGATSLALLLASAAGTLGPASEAR
jgi:dihydroxyacetone kinase-like protein